MTLPNPPSFNSPEPLSARFVYKHLEQNGTLNPWVFGCTGYAFIRAAWDALQNFSFEDSSAYPTLATDGRSGPLGLTYAAGLNGLPYIGGDGARRFRVNAPTEEGAQGISWDNDFNRALWCWTYQQWQASRAARGLPSMRSAHRGRIGRNAIAAVPFLIPFLPFTIGSAIYEAQQEMNDPEIRAWWGVLDAIELCELQQRVNLPALQMACCLVALKLDLISRTDSTMIGFLSDETIPPPYRGSPPRPADPTGEIASARFRTWPYNQTGGDPATGRYVSNDPTRPTPTEPPAQGTPPAGTTPTYAPFYPGTGPQPARGMSAGGTMALTAGYTLGGVLIAAGAASAIFAAVRRDESRLEVPTREPVTREQSTREQSTREQSTRADGGAARGPSPYSDEQPGTVELPTRPQLPSAADPVPPTRPSFSEQRTKPEVIPPFPLPPQRGGGSR